MSGLKIAISSDETTSILQADSTTQGVLVPRMTTAQRDAIATPALGLLIFNTTNNQLEESVTGSVWQAAGGGGGAKYPQRAHWFHAMSTVTAGNALTKNQTTTYYEARAYQSPAALNDAFTYSFLMAAGTYTLRAWGQKNNDRAIMSIYIDDVLQGTQDWYNAGGNVDDVEMTTSITVVGNGRHVLKAIMASKNAGSGGYLMVLTMIDIYPATDTTDVE